MCEIQQEQINNIKMLPKPNLSQKEQMALNNLAEREDVIIKADKCRAVVFLMLMITSKKQYVN